MSITKSNFFEEMIPPIEAREESLREQQHSSLYDNDKNNSPESDSVPKPTKLPF